MIRIWFSKLILNVMKEMRDIYTDTLIELAEKDTNIVVLEADLMLAHKTTPFKEKFPEALIKVTGMAAIFVKVETNALISLARSYLYALIIGPSQWHP